MAVEFVAPAYISLHDAMARVGEASVEGWDGTEVVPRSPSAENASLVIGGTWIDQEYDERYWSVGLPRLCAPSADAAARLAETVAQLRQLVSEGRLQLLFLTEDGYQPVPLRAILRDDAIFMVGRYGGFGTTELVVVSRTELGAVLRKVPGPTIGTSRDERDCERWLRQIMACSPSRKTASKSELEEQWRGTRKGTSKKAFERAWGKAASEYPAWSMAGRMGKSSRP